MSAIIADRRQRIVQWITGGRYAVAVEVEAVFPSEDPSEPCLTPETTRYLEELADRAEAEDVEALRRAGTVFLRIDSAQHAMAATGTYG